MIRVTVSIEPGGDPTRAREIADIEVWNDRGDIDEADYKYEAKLEGGRCVEGEVRGHRRAWGWAPLIARVVASVDQQIKAMADPSGKWTDSAKAGPKCPE